MWHEQNKTNIVETKLFLCEIYCRLFEVVVVIQRNPSKANQAIDNPSKANQTIDKPRKTNQAIDTRLLNNIITIKVKVVALQCFVTPNF